MTNYEILKLAMKEASKNGYEYRHDIDAISEIKFPENFWDILFSHDFAKAFWGEEVAKYVSTNIDASEVDEIIYKPQERWKHHLQQMVLEEDPIQYLKQFLFFN